jgi:Raf kinase inhibitor-like YbhB/YbcL family protein
MKYTFKEIAVTAFIFFINCYLPEHVVVLKIESPLFKEGELIPSKYTCDGENISPPLIWKDAPEGTKSFALICDDPDAPVGDWVHWVIYNIPAEDHELKEGASSKKLLPKGSVEGITDFRKTGYGGPCPPSGIHRYFFKLYSLNTILHLPAGTTKNKLLEAMQGHIISQAALIGKYSRKK